MPRGEKRALWAPSAGLQGDTEGRCRQEQAAADLSFSRANLPRQLLAFKLCPLITMASTVASSTSPSTTSPSTTFPSTTFPSTIMKAESCAVRSAKQPDRSLCQRDVSQVASWLVQGIKVETEARSLTFNESTLDPLIKEEYEGQQCLEATTRGDGACGVHAAFGREVSGEELFCADPRSLIRALLGSPWNKIKAEARPHIWLGACQCGSVYAVTCKHSHM